LRRRARNIAKLPALDELKIGSGFGEKKLTADGLRAIVEARVPAKFEFDKKLNGRRAVSPLW